MKNRKIIPSLIYLLVLFLLFSWIFPLSGLGQDNLSYSQILELFRNEQVERFTVQGTDIRLELSSPYSGKDSLTCRLADQEAFRQDVAPYLETVAEYDFLPVSQVTPMSYVLPLLIVGGILLVAWFFLASRANANNAMASFGKARAVLGIPDDHKVTFDDVAGAEEEKEELREVVDFLKDPARFTDMGARIPHGILLVGPPGTGKTLLARAVAGEADVQFLSISGSDFVEMYVGVGASRVRDLFDQAKKLAPAIIFIDEIDAVGRKRGSGLGGGHDEREQTLNQLLVEMDGFGKNSGVIVLAATNRPDVLDPALLRPGRFDRQVYVGAPDAKGREEVLKVHAKNKRLDASVDLRTIALATVGFTGADLQNLLNEAAILATRAERPVITMDDLNQAMMKVIAGPEKRSRARIEKDIRMTAVHEAGHAVAMYLLPTHDPVHQITVIPRGQALGITWSRPAEESNHLTRNEMYEMIVGLLGGRVAEELTFHDVSTGASNDIDRASKLARDMVARYGMSKALGTISFESGDEVFIGGSYGKTKSYSEKTACTIDDEVKALMDQAYDHCTRLLTEHSDKLRQVADFLVAHETMSGEQFAACMEGREIPMESTGTLFDSFLEKEE